MRFIKSINDIIDSFSKYMVSLLILGMLFFSLFAIVSRWFAVSFIWIEPLVRHMVFFSTFLGGVLAVSKRSHISIDILTRLIEERISKNALKFLRAIISLITVLILFLVIYSSYQFVKVEVLYGRDVFWGIKSGTLVYSIPVGFFLIAMRFILQIIEDLFFQKDLK